jgi:hypothetical protein
MKVIFKKIYFKKIYIGLTLRGTKGEGVAKVN